jgi:putative ABC transport system permease protein
MRLHTMGWTRIFRRKHWDEERARELESYVEFETSENMQRGIPPSEARHAARRKLRNSTLIREEIYSMNTIGWLEPAWQDLRYGARMLRKSIGFTLVAVLSLALGIGATTAIFSVVYGVLIAPYPYARSGEIWAPELRAVKSRQGRPHHLSEILEMRKLPAFAAVMATIPDTQLLTGDHAPENFTAIQVTANAFDFLGVPPVLGRTILPSDVKPGNDADPVIVLSYGAWQRLFDGKASALGKQLILNDQPRTVIGVMPPRFGWYTHDGGWVPMPIDLRADPIAADIVRLTPGVSRTVAEQQLHALHLRIAKEKPLNYPRDGFVTSLANYLDITVAAGEMQSSLKLLFGAVGFLLLIACANVANLQMARGTARAREIAVRMSVGAGRGRILRQLLTESVVLSFAGGLLGIAFAVAITRGTVALMPEFYVPNEARITVNGYVLLFSAAVSVLTGILFGLVPAFQCSRPDLVEALKEGTRGAGVATGGRTRNALVVVEIALSVILLMGASLTIRGFANLQKVDLGFQPDRVLLVSLPTHPKRYTTYDQRIAWAQNMLDRVSAIPGVEAAAIGNGAVPFGGPQSAYSIDGRPQADSQRVTIGFISADYARTMGIPLRAGRVLEKSEIARHNPVALINEAAAKLWPAGQNPIGGRIHLDWLQRPGRNLTPPGATQDLTVVGIVGDTRNAGLRDPAAPAVLVPYTLIAPQSRTVALRTASQQPMLLLNALRQEVRTVDKDQPVARPLTMEEVVGFETVQPRFNMALFSFFAGLGLTLAVVGIYSVLSYSVARRTHEIGVRMALGAEGGDVLSLMLGAGCRLLGIGLTIGLLAGFALSKLLRSDVFQAPATDPVAIAGVVIVLSAAGLLACLVPARRAARLDPTIALRHE